MEKYWALKIKSEIFQLFLIFNICMETGRWASLLILSSHWQWLMNNVSSLVTIQPCSKYKVKLLQSTQFLFAMTNRYLKTSHYEAGRNTANIKSYYPFDIKTPVCLMWFYCKATFIQLTSILLSILNHRNACKPSEWYPFVIVNFDNH